MQVGRIASDITIKNKEMAIKEKGYINVEEFPDYIDVECADIQDTLHRGFVGDIHWEYSIIDYVGKPIGKEINVDYYNVVLVYIMCNIGVEKPLTLKYRFYK